MPYLEILAPAIPIDRKATLAKSITDGLMSAFDVDAPTVTLYFLPVTPDDYAHAGEMGTSHTSIRVLLKVHAFRRGAAQRRAAAVALTEAACLAYGTEGSNVAVYFLDREKDEVAHDSKLASD